MKKILLIALSLIMPFILIACAPAQQTTTADVSPSASTVVSPTTNSSEPTAEASPSESENTAISADENLLTVEITLPASMFEGKDMTTFDAQTYAKEQGFKNATLNQDGSVTVTMTKLKHSELLKAMTTQYDESFAKMVGAPGSEFIQKITHTDNFDKITVDVDRTGFEAAKINMTPFVLGMSGMLYQSFIEMDKHVEIIIRDGKTGETIKTIVYPDAMGS